MGSCINSNPVAASHTPPDEENNINRKAQQLALEEEMEKLRQKQTAGWEEDHNSDLLNGQTNTIDPNDDNTRTQLLNMGFNEYMIKQAFKYSDHNDDLLKLIEWIESHKMTKEERENYKIISICKQLSNINIKCSRLQALHALDEISKLRREQEDDEGVINECINYIVSHGEDYYNNLSNMIQDEYMLRDQMIMATIQSVEYKRQNSFDWRHNKPILMAELRSMGFLQTVINNALSSNEIKDKKSAIKWIMNNPLSEEEELNAKIREIMNSGFSEQDAVLSLNKFDNNLEHSLLWLNQNKADQINHYLYHYHSKCVLEVEVDHESLKLNDVNFNNEYQKWSIWKNGRVKNFDSSKILTVKCMHSKTMNTRNEETPNENILNEDILNEDILNEDILNEDILNEDISNDDTKNDELDNETNPFLMEHDNDSDDKESENENEESNPFDIMNDIEISEIKQDPNDNKCDDDEDIIEYEICICSENIINSNNNAEYIEYLTNWIIDADERMIKIKFNDESDEYLYFVCRDNKFVLDSKYHENDMQQRWYILSKLELTELNPKQLAKELDDPDAECLICFDNDPNVMLNPCGHSNFCKICIDEYKPQQCPICRTKIKSVLEKK